MWREAADKFWDIFQLQKVGQMTLLTQQSGISHSSFLSAVCTPFLSVFPTLVVLSQDLPECYIADLKFQLSSPIRKGHVSFIWQVYYISGGQLKMANKKFASVKNDYELNLGANARVS